MPKMARSRIARLILVLAVLAGMTAWWFTPTLHSQAASDPSAQGRDLLDAVVRSVRTTFIQKDVQEDTLYNGAIKAALEAAGSACARAVEGPAAAGGAKTKFYALLDGIAERCTSPRPGQDTLFLAAAKGMLEALGDPYTRFMEPRAYHEFLQDAQGFFFGIGIFIDLKDKHLIVVQPIPGTPAARAGLRAGDRIKRIDDVSTEGMALQEAVVRIRGPKGTPVRLSIGRSDREFDVTIVRDRIEIKAAEGPESLDETARRALQAAGIGYVKLVTFNENTARAFDQTFTEVRRSGARALILDLRNNGGGLLDISLQVADRFVPAGQPLVHTVDRNGHRQTERASRRSKVGMPVIVLVNEFTASASEIVSGALQDTQIATLLGVRTFGKGVIQSVVDLPMKSGAAITTAKYLTPNGRDIHGKGLTPDVVVGESEETLRAKLKGRPDAEIEQRVEQMRADQLLKAIELLKKKLQRSTRLRPAA